MIMRFAGSFSAASSRARATVTSRCRSSASTLVATGPKNCAGSASMIARSPASVGDLSVAVSSAVVKAHAGGPDRQPDPDERQDQSRSRDERVRTPCYLAYRDERPAADQRCPHRGGRHDGPLRGGPQVIDRLQRRRQRGQPVSRPLSPPAEVVIKCLDIPEDPERVKIAARPCGQVLVRPPVGPVPGEHLPGVVEPDGPEPGVLRLRIDRRRIRLGIERCRICHARSMPPPYTTVIPVQNGPAFSGTLKFELTVPMASHQRRGLRFLKEWDRGWRRPGDSVASSGACAMRSRSACSAWFPGQDRA